MLHGLAGLKKEEVDLRPSDPAQAEADNAMHSKHRIHTIIAVSSDECLSMLLKRGIVELARSLHRSVLPFPHRRFGRP